MLPNKHEYEYEYQLFYLENIPFGATSITKNNNVVNIFILSFWYFSLVIHKNSGYGVWQQLGSLKCSWIGLGLKGD